MTEQQEEQPEISPEVQALRSENDDLLARVTTLIGVAFGERLAGKSGLVLLGSPRFGLAISVISDEEPGTFEQISESVRMLCSAAHTIAAGADKDRHDDIREVIAAAFSGKSRPEADG